MYAFKQRLWYVRNKTTPNSTPLLHSMRRKKVLAIDLRMKKRLRVFNEIRDFEQAEAYAMPNDMFMIVVTRRSGNKPYKLIYDANDFMKLQSKVDMYMGETATEPAIADGTEPNDNAVVPTNAKHAPPASPEGDPDSRIINPGVPA